MSQSQLQVQYGVSRSDRRSQQEAFITFVEIIQGFVEKNRGYVEIRAGGSRPVWLLRVHWSITAPSDEQTVDFSISVDTDLPRRVRGDEARLVQVLTNLVSNAIKFTEKGTVDVLIQQESPSIVSFTVRDTGIGIDLDSIDELFESFRQADNSIRRRYGGTGLGLSITRSLVHMMGGTITVTSTPGEGSTFVITLPLPAVTSSSEYLPEVPAKPSEVGTQAAKLNILCVDDNPVNLEVACVVLEEAGHSCVPASSGREGILHLSQQGFDVVLMECHMDGLDGFETARRMLESHPNLPIVALTADATTSAVQASQKAGMCEVLTKPFKPDVLIELIERLGKQRAVKTREESTRRQSMFMEM